MRLKAMPKDGFRLDVCAAIRCGASSIEVIAAGTVFDLEKGEVPLCTKHYNKLLLEGIDVPDESSATSTTAPPTTTKMTQWVEPQEQAALQVEANEAQDALREIEGFEIRGQDDYDFADELLGDVKRNWKTLEERKKRAVGPLNESLKEIRSWFSAPQKFYKSAEELLKQKLLGYVALQRQEQDRLLAEAEQAYAAGDSPGVSEAVRQAVVSEVDVPRHTTIRQVWRWEVVDKAQIPIDLLTPDVHQINELVQKYQGETQIPGIRVSVADSMIRRTTG